MGTIKNIAVTGSTGFLGSFIVKKLIEVGFKPILILRSKSDTWRIKENLSQCTICVLDGSIKEIEKLMSSIDIDCIINLATDYGRNTSLSALLMTNIIFPLSMIEEGKKRHLKLFVNTDSFFAKKQYNQSYLNAYTNSKRILESFLLDSACNLKIANLRIEHVFGENDAEEKFFTSIIKKLLMHHPSIDLTEGTQKRDFIYAKDVANAYYTVISNYSNLNKYEEFEIGSGHSISIKEFVDKLAKIGGSRSSLNFGGLPTREGDIADSQANIEKLTKLGWKQLFGIDQAIEQIIENEKERFKL